MTYLGFGIRDLLWAMVVAGLSVALWSEVTERGRVARMSWQWREMYAEGLMSRPVKHVSINYMDGPDAIYDENRGVRILNE
jgi:hypothetical protein